MISTLDWADRLTALASHLTNRPDLMPVDCYQPISAGEPVDLYLKVPQRADRAPALLAWARSLDDDEQTVEVRNSFDAAHVVVYSELDDHPVALRCTIPGLAYVMGDDAFDFTRDRMELGGIAWITVDALAEWVKHGAAPTPVETPVETLSV